MQPKTVSVLSVSLCFELYLIGLPGEVCAGLAGKSMVWFNWGEEK
jgi:hypothetical protein